MFVDSYEYPKRPVQWLYRCQECGNTENTTVDEAMLAYGNLVSKATDDA